MTQIAQDLDTKQHASLTPQCLVCPTTLNAWWEAMQLPTKGVGGLKLPEQEMKEIIVDLVQIYLEE